MRNSPVVALIGIKDAQPVGIDCGAHSHQKCMNRSQINALSWEEFAERQCAIRLIDLCIAVGSAVKMASLMNVDNRIMYRIGLVARQMGFMDAELIMGAPLPSTGKNIYFDRK